MRVIVAGSRDIQDPEIVRRAIEASGFKIDELVSGGCRGVDKLGEKWAESTGIPVKVFIADWDKYAKSAGPIRNAEMANYSEALIAIWDGNSRGTGNMIDLANKHGLSVYVYDAC